MPGRSPARCAGAGPASRGARGPAMTAPLVRPARPAPTVATVGSRGKQRSLLSPTGVDQVPMFSAAPPSARPEVFRRTGPLVVWWIWLAFALFNVVDLAIQGSGHLPAVVTAILVAITGV